MSKTSIRIACLVLGTALILSATRPPAVPEQEQPSALLEAMEGLKTHLKGTAMALQRSSRDEALENIAGMQRFVLLAKLEAPADLGEIAEEKREAHRTAFRKDLVLLLKELADMELDVLEGRYKKAFARVVDPLYPLREAAHEKYQKGE